MRVLGVLLFFFSRDSLYVVQSDCNFGMNFNTTEIGGKW